MQYELEYGKGNILKFEMYFNINDIYHRTLMFPLTLSPPVVSISHISDLLFLRSILFFSCSYSTLKINKLKNGEDLYVLLLLSHQSSLTLTYALFLLSLPSNLIEKIIRFTPSQDFTTKILSNRAEQINCFLGLNSPQKMLSGESTHHCWLAINANFSIPEQILLRMLQPQLEIYIVRYHFKHARLNR